MAVAATANSLFSESSDNVQGPTISSSVPSVSECSHRGGFTGMFKVPSLVFDIELEDNGIGGHWQEDDWEEDEVVTEIQRFVQPATQVEARLLSDVRLACPHAKDGQDTARLVSILSALGYNCSLRTALGGGDGADCLRNLRHTFISCEAPGTNGLPGRRYIIDPQFKEQFIIAKTTSRYASILAAIPQVFVGPEEHLSLLVNFLCTEMSAAFRQLGSVLPPWRHASSMLSKWQPRKSVEDGTTSGVRLGDDQAADGSNTSRAAGGEANGVSDHTQAAVDAQGAGSSQFMWTAVRGGQQQQPQRGQQQWPPMAAGGGAPGGANRRPSFEPLRVVMGGNFTPINPSPAPAS